MDTGSTLNGTEIYIGRKEDGGCETSGVIMDDWYLFETRLDSCNTEVNLNETHVQYVNYIQIKFKIGNNFITRNRDEFANQTTTVSSSFRPRFIPL